MCLEKFSSVGLISLLTPCVLLKDTRRYESAAMCILLRWPGGKNSTFSLELGGLEGL